MSSLTRMLNVLGLFNEYKPLLTADEIIIALTYTRPTGYRYIKALCSAGFLARFAGGYSLGPRIAELNYYIVQSDPLIRQSRPIMRDICMTFGCDALLASMYGEHMIATHHEHGADALMVSYGRGRLMPLFRGAGSKVILAFLPAARQRMLFERHKMEILQAGLGPDWESFRRTLRIVRRDGYALSKGELDDLNVGIAAPIFHDGSLPPASIILVISKTRIAIADQDMIVDVAKNAAKQISERIRNTATLIPTVDTASSGSSIGVADRF
jgi:DNA-binding IclR family transcriptional regulator